MIDALLLRTAELLRRQQNQPNAALTFRDIQLRPQEQRTIASQRGYVLLSDLDDWVVVDSDLGVYDRLSPHIAECQHVHAGEIVFQNYSDRVQIIEVAQLTWGGAGPRGSSDQ